MGLSNTSRDIFQPSINNSFSYIPTVVNPKLIEKCKLEAEFTTNLALVNKQLKDPHGKNEIFKISNEKNESFLTNTKLRPWKKYAFNKHQRNIHI